jgi:hypothetical protein
MTGDQQRYRSWLVHVFDHEVRDPQWHFDIDAPTFEATPAEVTELLRLTFKRAATDLRDFTDAQVNQGIWYLASPSCSNFSFALKAGDVPLEPRIQAVQSIRHLYSGCFAERCTETLSHLDEQPCSDLNSICYMFWDVFPLTYLQDTAGEKELSNAVFNVLTATLEIDHRACREAALHGFAEVAYAYPERVENAISRVLNRLRKDGRLYNYACNAMTGNVP